jgi:beta-xylosidase
MNDTTIETYRNPVVFQDLSDPDAIRVGSLWYMVASSFCNVPALPVYSSADLVEWKFIGFALDRLEPEEHYRSVRSGCGVWAPAIRFYDGEFSIWYPDPDFGIFTITAKNPCGPWSKPKLVQPSVGSIDPCPFIDDDGSRWMVKAWAKSRCGFNNRLTLVPLDGENRAINEGVAIIDGFTLPPAKTTEGDKPWITIEGPKLYKRNGWYYIFAPAGGVKIGWQGVFRSRSLKGPWESRVVMDQGKSIINGPHQGAWVDAPDGADWFLHFQDREAWGRITHLQPMSWDDDWPIIGIDRTGTKIGEPVETFTRPLKATTAREKKPDDFSEWQWNANPSSGWIDATSKGIKLCCIPGPRNPWENPSVYSRQITGPSFALQAKLIFSPRNNGETAGIVIEAFYTRWVGLRHDAGGLSLILEDYPEAETERHTVITRIVREKASASVWLRAIVFDKTENGTVSTVARTEWSNDGLAWEKIGDDFPAYPGRWVGMRTGFMACAPFGTLSSTASVNGYAEIESMSCGDF